MKAQYDDLDATLKRLNRAPSPPGDRRPAGPPNAGFEPDPVILAGTRTPPGVPGWEASGEAGAAIEVDRDRPHGRAGGASGSTPRPRAARRRPRIRSAPSRAPPDRPGLGPGRSPRRPGPAPVRGHSAGGRPPTRPGRGPGPARLVRGRAPGGRTSPKAASDRPGSGSSCSAPAGSGSTTSRSGGDAPTESERLNARRDLIAALSAYRAKRYADFARLAGSHWTRQVAGNGGAAAIAGDRPGRDPDRRRFRPSAGPPAAVRSATAGGPVGVDSDRNGIARRDSRCLSPATRFAFPRSRWTGPSGTSPTSNSAGSTWRSSKGGRASTPPTSPTTSKLSLGRLRDGPSITPSALGVDFGDVRRPGLPPPVRGDLPAGQDPDRRRHHHPRRPPGHPVRRRGQAAPGLAGYAMREGLVLALMTDSETLTADPSQAAALCKAVPGLGLTLDPSHYIQGPLAGGNYDEVFPFVQNVLLRDTGKKPGEFQVRIGQGRDRVRPDRQPPRTQRLRPRPDRLDPRLARQPLRRRGRGPQAQAAARKPDLTGSGGPGAGTTRATTPSAGGSIEGAWSARRGSITGGPPGPGRPLGPTGSRPSRSGSRRLRSRGRRGPSRGGRRPRRRGGSPAARGRSPLRPG